MNPTILNMPLTKASENTQKVRIVLSANAIRILEALALAQINTVNVHPPLAMLTLKELYLASCKASSKLEVGLGVSYNTSGAIGLSIEDKLGLSQEELNNPNVRITPISNSTGKASIKSESELLMEMSEEERNKKLQEYQDQLMQEFNTPNNGK